MLGFKSTSLLAFASILSACSHAGSITRISTDYNRAMSDVRNEQLLLNIMRASGREPLQFSAMGEVAATVHRTAGIDTVLSNLTAGRADSITHTISLGANNEPVIKINPLSNKEFIGGILRPTTPEALEQFMEFGWDPEFMLPLLVAGYQCPNEEGFRPNSGRTEGDAVRAKLVASLNSLNLRKVETPGKQLKLVVPDDKALEMLRTGVAGGYKVESVTRDMRSGNSLVIVSEPAKSTWVANLDACGANTPMSFEGMPDERSRVATEAPAGQIALADRPIGYIKLRSVEGIIYFLGERFRECYLGNKSDPTCDITYVAHKEQQYLFRLRSGSVPANTAAVRTKFYGKYYWVSRLDTGDSDLTLKTWSFLNQLIALQTEPSAISTTPTVLSIGGK